MYGKLCLNSIPKTLVQKFGDNKELFNELKQFITNSAMLEKGNIYKTKLWTFPEFKTQIKVPKYFSAYN